jgi:hypothetical protein
MAYDYSISGMVCHRCVLSVKDILKSIPLPFEKVSIGQVSLRSMPDENQSAEFNEILKEIDLHVLESR